MKSTFWMTAQETEDELKRREILLYSLGGDVFTTKRPECGECGFTVRKDGSCGFCQ